jgi:hypothetical protein
MDPATTVEACGLQDPNVVSLKVGGRHPHPCRRLPAIVLAHHVGGEEPCVNLLNNVIHQFWVPFQVLSRVRLQ